ncbi:MAG: type II secretion system protein GspG [Desulfovibrionaceae bacterium]|nr:type II secretion system protein GspG [Desulfovibrionaceae bacterium]MBF0513741.1 type II secretion system protein GspG [Desulfovibrionaceae bacterium]
MEYVDNTSVASIFSESNELVRVLGRCDGGAEASPLPVFSVLMNNIGILLDKARYFSSRHAYFKEKFKFLEESYVAIINNKRASSDMPWDVILEEIKNILDELRVDYNDNADFNLRIFILNNKFVLSLSLAIVLMIFLSIVYCFFEDTLLNNRVSDLTSIKIALEHYYAKNNKYPESIGFDGIYSYYGESREDWIKGIVPRYLARLPRDPRNNTDPSNQYLYNSNGQDYKLISHHPDDCEKVKLKHPEMIDPVRSPCNAYGYWTKNAANW